MRQTNPWETREWSLHRGVNIDIAASLRLFGGSSRILKKLEEDITPSGLGVRAAVAPTIGAAWALSRFAPEKFILVELSELTKSLSPLPLSALRISPLLVSALAEVNITTIEEVLSISTQSLRSRFGKELTTRLNQIFGKEEELIQSAPRQALAHLAKVFEGPLEDLDVLCFAAEELLSQLLNMLHLESKSLRQCALVLRTVNNASIHKNLTLSAPSLNKKHIWSILRNFIEQIKLAEGITSLHLHLLKAENIRAHPLSSKAFPSQSSTPPTSQTSASLGELIDTFRYHLGTNHVLEINCRESHLPEEGFSFMPAKPERKNAGFRVVDTERPSLLFHYPRQVQALALLPDSPPAWIKWKGKIHHLALGIGPERIAPPWWGADNVLNKTRDYFRVQLEDGLWLWIYRELETQHWFVHGVWS